MARLRYGPQRCLVDPIPQAFAASQAFHRRGGAFCHLDGSGHAVRASEDSTVIAGWWEVPGFSVGAEEVSGDLFTTSSTAGTVYENFIRADPTTLYLMPTDEALTLAILAAGAPVDLLISSTKQVADIGASTDNLLVLAGGNRQIDAGASEAYVQVVAAKIQGAA